MMMSSDNIKKLFSENEKEIKLALVSLFLGTLLILVNFYQYNQSSQRFHMSVNKENKELMMVYSDEKLEKRFELEKPQEIEDLNLKIKFKEADDRIDIHISINDNKVKALSGLREGSVRTVSVDKKYIEESNLLEITGNFEKSSSIKFVIEEINIHGNSTLQRAIFLILNLTGLIIIMGPILVLKYIEYSRQGKLKGRFSVTKKVTKLAAVFLLGGLLLGSTNYLILDVTQESISKPLYCSRIEEPKYKAANNLEKGLKNSLEIMCSHHNVASENCEIGKLKDELGRGEIENYSELKIRASEALSFVYLRKRDSIIENTRKSESYSEITANILLDSENSAFTAIVQAWIGSTSGKFIDSCKENSVPPQECLSKFKSKLKKIYEKEFQIKKYKKGKKPGCGLKQLGYFSKEIYSKRYNQTFLKFFNGMRRHTLSETIKEEINFKKDGKNITINDLCEMINRIPYNSIRILFELSGTMATAAEYTARWTTTSGKLTNRIEKEYNLTEVNR